MSSFSEDQLLPTLTWTDQSCTLSEFIDQYSLPKVVRVETGYCGGTDVPALELDDVLMLHALRKTHKLTAEDGDGNTIEIALSCPYRLQILPKKKKCKLNRCGVGDLLSIYPKVKYLEVIEAHYGTNIEDDTSVGELLEIISTDKHHNKVDVKNVKTGWTFTLTFACTAQFRPLRDWKSYCAKDIKTQLGFPTRVRFLDTEGDDSTLQKLVSKTPVVNVVGEIEEVLVIATMVTTSVRLKFCYEIPKDLEIVIAVAKGSVNGQKYYQELVDNLHSRFDVSKFVSIQELEYLNYRHKTIIEYDYQSIIKNISGSNRDTKNDVGPPLPPRSSVRRTKSIVDNSSSKPAIAPKPRRTRSESVPVELANVSKTSQVRPPRRSPRAPNCPLGSNVDPDPESVRRQWSDETKPCPQNDDKNWSGTVGNAQGEDIYDNTEPPQIYESPMNMNENAYMALLKEDGDAVTTSDDHGYQSYIKGIQTESPQIEDPSRSSESETEEDPYVEISMIPEDLSLLGVQDVSRLLRILGIGCYVQKFEEEQIDGKMLMSLQKSEFESLDVTAFHITKLIKFINGWRPKP